MTQHDAASFSALVDQQLEAAQRGLDALLALPSGASAEEVSATFDRIGREIIKLESERLRKTLKLEELLQTLTITPSK